MPRPRMTVGRRPSSEAAADVVTAAVQPSYELTQGSQLDLAFNTRIEEGGYPELGRASWPFEATLDWDENVVGRDDGAVLFEIDGGIVLVSVGYGWLRVGVAALSRDRVEAIVARLAEKYPPLYRQPEDDGTVPITFWALSPHGPISRLRMIEASPWADIAGNYSAPVRSELERLVDPEFTPGAEGQLLLWQGPPGTGKTWVLRALAHEWSAWAEFHYITDPDALFVDSADYLSSILMADTYEELAVSPGGGETVVSSQREGRWRVLILEDTGELLSAGAKEKYGQGLSRVLNVVDGMLGQGLRVLVLVTTNDELGDLHPAVLRPGRCASRIEFGPLSASEASVWLGRPVDEEMTIAELYAARAGAVTAAAPGAVYADAPDALEALLAEARRPLS